MEMFHRGIWTLRIFRSLLLLADKNSQNIFQLILLVVIEIHY
jgi:hypothetical protein